MNYKRLETYVGWTCNQKCTYCMEYPNMEQAWNKKITKYDILKKLIKYKKLWYNHVTYLWWEPFIQWVFLDALKIWKKLWYKILVTTNCTTLHIDNQASKYLPYIDELILSVEAIDKDRQQVISRTKTYVKWEEVFINIKKYWAWNYLKANIVITKDNLDILFDLVKYVFEKWVNNIAITYPDIALWYYWKQHILEKVAPSYTDCANVLNEIIKFCEDKNINLKLPDFPFCIFPNNDIERYIKLTDDFDYQTRVKVDHKDEEEDRKNLIEKKEIPRERYWLEKCDTCKYKWKCWGPSLYYKELFWLDEINPIN